MLTALLLKPAFYIIGLAAEYATFDVSSQTTTPHDIFFKSGGTIMYVVDFAGSQILQYALSIAWDITSASYTKAFDCSAEEASPTGAYFKSDGTKMYVCGFSTQTASQYALSSAWDVGTAAFETGKTADFSGESMSGDSLWFNTDGTKMFVAGNGAPGPGAGVHEYALSVAHDISTATYSQVKATPEISDTIIYCGVFDPSGTKMFVTGAMYVHQYALSIAFDVSTATYMGRTAALTPGNANGVFFHPGGFRMFLPNNANDEIRQYIL